MKTLALLFGTRKRNRRALLLIAILGFLIPANAQDDFLTRGEVDEVRDKQEPDKRIELYLDFAQRRIDTIKAGLTDSKPGAGRAAQKILEEYTSILEAVESTLEDGRENRGVGEKALKAAEERKVEFLTYLQSIDAEESPGYEDYHFTLEEAIAVTEEVLANVRQGAFPEVQGREPPRMPSAPPPRERREIQAPPTADEEGPPRRSRPTAAPTADEEGPPRRSRPAPAPPTGDEEGPPRRSRPR